MTEAMPFLQKHDITFLRPPTIMHLLFALEDRCRITITDDDYAFRLEIPDQEFTLLSIDLLSWKEKQAQLREGEITKEEYDNWRYNF